MTRFVSAREAIARIHDYDTLAHCGFVGFSVPEYLLETLAQKYRETGHPHSLTLIKSIGVSDKKDTARIIYLKRISRHYHHQPRRPGTRPCGTNLS